MQVAVRDVIPCRRMHVSAGRVKGVGDDLVRVRPK